jgi:deoxyribodipyrimidine photo-lyase
LKSFNPEITDTVISLSTTLFWFRRDLRLKDNAGLYHALSENEEVLPLFIFDTTILGELEDKDDARVNFIHQSLSRLKDELETLGSSLLVLCGDPREIFTGLNPRCVYTNRDYEPYARQRDDTVQQSLARRGIDFKTFKDQVIFDHDEVLKHNGRPYTVFTPYSRKWKSKQSGFYFKGYPTENYFHGFKKIHPLPYPSLADIGFAESQITFPQRSIPKAIIERYDKQRNFPALAGTSKLSVHLRFGTVSIRTLAKLAAKTSQVWLNELIWRDFYQMILWHFPHVVTRSFKPSYVRIAWRNDPEDFKAWCSGKTGFPIVDAGMRELNTTGFMHNRVRMIVASFLCKHLLIDWRWGEGYFAMKLLDYDFAANNGGWQWAAGSGSDAAPYFRVFNPSLQAEKFDPKMEYIRKWVPEFESADYPPPIVEHNFARNRALTVYKQAMR